MIFEIQSSMLSPQVEEKADNSASDLLKAIPRVFPAHMDRSIIQTGKQKKEESDRLLRPVWKEALSVQHSRFYTRKEVTQPALAALFVNVLSPETRGLIKRQKIGWEVTSLTELVTTAEHFERTLEQDRNQKSNRLVALQLKQIQGQRPKISPQPLTGHPPCLNF